MQTLFDDIIEIDELVRSRRRTISIIIDKDAKIIVRAPLKVSEKEIFNFINDKKGWIRKKQAEVMEQKNRRKKKMFLSGEKFLFKGKEYPLVYKKKPVNVFEFDGENFIMDTDYKSQAGELFVKWYKKAARQTIQEKLDFFSKETGLTYNSIKINSAKSRWGSCSSKKNLNFSYRLILTPEFVINYVILHELAHTVEMNHSRRFWEIVESIYPDYIKAENWLKSNSYSLDF
jgi:predicted metal-dependent hydrolase